jgi:hypothetical protein
MQMRAKGMIIWGLMAAIAIGSFFATSRSGRAAYHKWRLAKAIENARTAGEGKPTTAQELVSMLRGEPSTSAEYEEAWRHHEEALVKLNLLTRREFTLPKAVNSADRGRIISAAERVFGAIGPWSVTVAAAKSNAIVVTAPPGDMPRWERLMYRLLSGGPVCAQSGFGPRPRT